MTKNRHVRRFYIPVLALKVQITQISVVWQISEKANVSFCLVPARTVS